jgi:galactose mutarotase-like enzyme
MPWIERSGSYPPYEAVTLENRDLRVVVLPELGGRIWSIVYKPLDREILWHNPHVEPQRIPFGSAFDDVWCGGWEEMFPTAAPGLINQVPFPDHGEVWCLPWTAELQELSDAATLRLFCQAPLSAAAVEKCLCLRGEEARLEVTYTLTNRSKSELPFMFALHPALAASAGNRIDFPQMSADLEPSYLGTLDGVTAPFAWPFALRHGKPLDLRTVCPASSKEVYFLYGYNYPSGWCALTDPAEHLTVGYVFPPEVLRSCWLFATYGGWRDYHVVLLEPCTSRPQQIEVAIAEQRAVRLAPGASWQAAVSFLVQRGLSSVSGLANDGRFRE